MNKGQVKRLGIVILAVGVLYVVGLFPMLMGDQRPPIWAAIGAGIVVLLVVSVIGAILYSAISMIIKFIVDGTA